MTEKTFEIDLSTLKKNWVFLALLAIFLLSFFVRTYTFHYNYLLNVDSYFEYRYIDFIVQYGDIPDRDYYMAVPEGLSTVGNRVDIPYQWLGAYSYLFTKIFFPQMQLWQFLIYLPALLASLAAIPAYYIGKCIYDKKAGIIMAFLVLFNQNIFMRSMGGDPDTDAIVVLLPLMVMALFLLGFKALEKTNVIKKSLVGISLNIEAIAFSALAGAVLAFFAYTWVGYWYMLYLVVGFVMFKVVADIISSAGKNKPTAVIKADYHLIANLLIFLAVFSALTLPVYFIAGPGNWWAYVNPLGFMQATQLKSEYVSNYPNVFISVQEMMSGGDIKETVQRAGTVLFFMTFVLCLPYLLITYFKSNKHMDTALLILMWSGGALFAAIFAVRFGILLATPICLGTSIVLAKLWRLALGEDKEIFE